MIIIALAIQKGQFQEQIEFHFKFTESNRSDNEYINKQPLPLFTIQLSQRTMKFA